MLLLVVSSVWGAAEMAAGIMGSEGEQGTCNLKKLLRN
jgi:hypothetical protein